MNYISYKCNQIERVELSDVKLPQEMQRAMATEAEASRNSRAKVTFIV